MSIAPTALFSPDRSYRYALTRWVPLVPGCKFARGTINIIMLNPSVADERVNDPTIRRCIRFAQDLCYTRLVVTNLFAYRGTSPEILKQVPEPVGSQNNEVLQVHAALADRVIVAWGVHGTLQAFNERGLLIPRDQQVIELLKDLGVRPDCFGETKDRYPKHPLYLPNGTWPTRYEHSLFSPEVTHE